jgi:hypothetical protein
MWPMMSARIARASIFWMRQIEKERTGGVTPGRGGRVQDFPGHVLGEEVGDELGVEPSSREVWVSCGQLVEAEQALHSLEGEFDLPAPAVEGEDVGGGEGVLVERGDEEDELGRLEGLRLDAALVFPGGLPGAGAARFGGGLVEAADDETDGKSIARGALRPDHDGALGVLAPGETVERCEEIERLAVKGTPAHGIPARPHDEMATRRAHRAQVACLEIGAVGDGDLARSDREAAQALAGLAVADLDRGETLAGKVVAGVQAPGSRLARSAHRGGVDDAHPPACRRLHGLVPTRRENSLEHRAEPGRDGGQAQPFEHGNVAHRRPVQRRPRRRVAQRQCPHPIGQSQV